MPGSLLKTYDPAGLIINFRRILIGGFGDSVVKVARNGDAYSLKVGTTGELARARSRDSSGYVEFTLQQSSDSNDRLSEAARLDDLFGTGTGALLVRDALGTTVVHGEGCYVGKLPDVEFSKTIGDRVWRIIVPRLDMFVGGAFATV